MKKIKTVEKTGIRWHESEIAERAYRKGFYQGYHAAKKWSDAWADMTKEDLNFWRYEVPLSFNVFPPGAWKDESSYIKAIEEANKRQEEINYNDKIEENRRLWKP